MILSISGVVLLGIIVFLFFRKDGLKALARLRLRALRLLPRGHGHRPEHQGRRREPRQPPGRDQVLTPSADRSHAPSGDRCGPATTPPHSEQRQRTDRPEPGDRAHGRRQRHRRPPSADHDHPWSAAAGRRPGGASGPRPPRTGVVPLLFLVASCVLVVALIPYGPLLALISVMARGRLEGPGPHARRRPAPTRRRPQRLQSLYEALVPYFSVAEDPAPLFAHGGDWEQGLQRLRVRRQRARSPGSGCATPRTSPTARPSPAPASSSCCTPSRAAAASTSSPGTRRATSSSMTRAARPVHRHRRPALRHRPRRDGARLHRRRRGPAHRCRSPDGEETRDVPPVVWRTGARSTEPHLLVGRASPAAAPRPCCAPSPSRPCSTATSSSSRAAAPASTPA